MFCFITTCATVLTVIKFHKYDDAKEVETCIEPVYEEIDNSIVLKNQKKDSLSVMQTQINECYSSNITLSQCHAYMIVAKHHTMS